MAQDDTAGHCPEAELAQAIGILQGDDEGGLARLEALSLDYPADPRLHFLRGSVLAGLQRYDEARTAMQGAVAIAPAFHVARYQLGFLQFTSGDAVGAMATWGPLHGLPDGHYLRLFATGLTHLAADEFEPALAALRSGLVANSENPPMNGDIQLLVSEIEKLAAGGGAPPAGAALQSGDSAPSTEPRAEEAGQEPLSSVSMLLQQSSIKPTRH